ncbi:MAG: N-acetylmuramoyl-L-alanine amidase [Bacteroidaceae bacterium]|nr:N-acetylmuramoyl-L-alanine amidase [Bacteroidaceae bacterium]
MRTITLIVLHCSGTRTTQKYSFRQCREDHLQRGWKDIGYHYYITRDGQVHEGRALWQVGAHCKGHNRHSIGICYEGGLDSLGTPCDTRTRAQRQSLRALLTRLHDQFPTAIILGHRDLSPDLDGNGRVDPEEWMKQCPCFDALLDYEDLEPMDLLDMRSDCLEE